MPANSILTGCLVRQSSVDNFQLLINQPARKRSKVSTPCHSSISGAGALRRQAFLSTAASQAYCILCLATVRLGSSSVHICVARDILTYLSSRSLEKAVSSTTRTVIGFLLYFAREAGSICPLSLVTPFTEHAWRPVLSCCRQYDESSLVGGEGATHPPPPPLRRKRIITAITVATGAILGIKILLALRKLNIETYLIISKWAATITSYLRKWLLRATYLFFQAGQPLWQMALNLRDMVKALDRTVVE